MYINALTETKVKKKKEEILHNNIIISGNYSFVFCLVKIFKKCRSVVSFLLLILLLLLFGGVEFVEFERLQRLAKVLVLPLGARLALDRAAPLERAIARRRHQHSPRVVTTPTAQQIASVNSFRCFIARSSGRPDRTFILNFKKIIWF
jgi:hypothetical protein